MTAGTAQDYQPANEDVPQNPDHAYSIDYVPGTEIVLVRDPHYPAKVFSLSIAQFKEIFASITVPQEDT